MHDIYIYTHVYIPYILYHFILYYVILYVIISYIYYHASDMVVYFVYFFASTSFEVKMPVS